MIDSAARHSARLVLLGAATFGFLLIALGVIWNELSAFAGIGVLLVAVPVIWAVKAVLELYTDARDEAAARSRLAKTVDDRVAALGLAFDQDRKSAGEELESLHARVKALSVRDNEASAALRTQEARLQSYADSQSSIVGNIDRVVERIRTLETDRTSLSTEQRRLSRSAAELQSSFDLLETKANASLDLLMGSANQGLSRLISPDDRSELEAHWLPRLGLGLSREAIHYIERRVLTIEQMSDGRLAAASADAVFRVLVALSIDGADLEVLEIGTLFGVNATVFHDMLGTSGNHVTQTLVDLFEGYYGSDKPDQYTGLVVSEELVDNNLRRAGADEGDFRLIKGDSLSTEVVEQVADRQYDLVLIDGDHSYEGVSGDFQRYWPLVKPGGFLLIDDYGAPSWPSVTRFVDELKSDPQFDREIEVFARTALIQSA